ncbi:MAG: Hsp20/alpha crystallin family protein [bacterium]
MANTMTKAKTRTTKWNKSNAKKYPSWTSSRNKNGPSPTWKPVSYTNYPWTGHAAYPTPYSPGYAPGYSGYSPTNYPAMFSNPQYQEKVNRIFDELIWQVENDTEGRPWTPRCDWWETGNTYTIRAYVPGCTQKDCHISLQGNTLTIYGTTSAQPLPSKANCYCNECYTGSFQRYFNFPASVDPKRVKAVCRNGVLMVTLYKVAKSTPVPVKVA